MTQQNAALVEESSAVADAIQMNLKAPNDVAV